MKKRLWSVSISVAALILIGALGVQRLQLRNLKEGDRSSGVQGNKLGERIPVSLSGWTSRDEPLGPNEVTRSEVEKTLNYDDYVYRIYRKADREIGVYVAYWSAGRMPMQKVASHTPDRCWTENGWECREKRFAETVMTQSLRLMPAQWRRFTPPANPTASQYVLFWHLVGSQLYDYGDRFNATPDFLKWWRDTVKFAFSGSAPQYFVRVTSNRPFDEIAADAAWAELVDALGRLGLEQRLPEANPG